MDPNTARDDDGVRLLASAVHWGHTEIVRLLLMHGADPNILTEKPSPSTILNHVASGGGQSTIEMAKMLVEAGARVEPLPHEWGPLCGAALAGNVQMFEWLLSVGANLDELTYNPSGSQTVLSCAAQRGSLDMIDLIIDHGVDVDIRDPRGRTPLMFAAETCADGADWCEKTVAHLLEHGANPMSKDQEGKMAMEYALSDNRAYANSSVAAVNLLIEWGAVPSKSVLAWHDRMSASSSESSDRILVLVGIGMIAIAALDERATECAVSLIVGAGIESIDSPAVRVAVNAAWQAISDRATGAEIAADIAASELVLNQALGGEKAAPHAYEKFNAHLTVCRPLAGPRTTSCSSSSPFWW